MRAISFYTIVLAVFVLSSCTTQKQKTKFSYSTGSSSGSGGGSGGGYAVADQSQSLYEGALTESKEQAVIERKVIYNGKISLQIKSPDSTNQKLSLIAKQFGGYVQTLGTDISVIRVQAKNIDVAMDGIAALGKVESRKISGTDVTEEFTNLEIRIANSLKARERYLELLAKAENVEAALKVEKELERVNLDIDNFQGRLNQIGHLSEYSTITVYMKERVKPGIIGYIGIGLYKSVKWLFVRN